jgi:ABC-type multidrug transport system ATPase subunit
VQEQAQLLDPRPSILNAARTASVVTATEASIDLRKGARLLDAVTTDVRAGEVVAIVGPSGAGKTTLLETLAGIRVPTSGRVEYGAPDVPIAFVPQDDIVHRDLTVAATVHYAARLRLPSGTSRPEIDEAATRTLAMLGLSDRGRQSVGSLSGGQRKRVSLATELVVRPAVCFLDEPTAGLDPIAASSLVHELRRVADGGTAIVMTTHNVADLVVADRLLVMAEGGRLVFDGPPAAGAEHLALPLPDRDCPGSDDATPMPLPAVDRTPISPDGGLGPPTPRSTRRSRFGQARVLARRNVDLLLRSRISLAIMTGSPLLVVAMFAVLFPTHAFDASVVDRGTTIAIVYWLAFAGFFFGLTFGLLQVCTELPILRRERVATIDIGPYLVAKAAVLVPVLAVINAMMLLTLSWLGRLPTLEPRQAFIVWSVLMLDAIAGLALGLLASSSVSNAAQAALALPMLCFPAVLFSGAVLPVVGMTSTGRGIATFISDRWAFEALARSLEIADGTTGAARHAVELHGDALSGPIGTHVLMMLALTAVFAVATQFVLARRTR